MIAPEKPAPITRKVFINFEYDYKNLVIVGSKINYQENVGAKMQKYTIFTLKSAKLLLED